LWRDNPNAFWRYAEIVQCGMRRYDNTVELGAVLQEIERITFSRMVA